MFDIMFTNEENAYPTGFPPRLIGAIAPIFSLKENSHEKTR
jgi:hypothetical protein